ncbi:S1C family serine protease [Noviherbaspirillum aridicola]|nr:trypsin-like peptidase domain-containing protein [Noviherbaspirillum aridicola]
MKRNPVYSKSRRSGSPAERPVTEAVAPTHVPPAPGAESAGARDRAAAAPGGEPPLKPPRRARLRAMLARHDRVLLVLCSVLVCAMLFAAYEATRPEVRLPTQRDIDAAVKHTLVNNVFPSEESRAYARIRPSVVRVTQYDADEKGEKGEKGEKDDKNVKHQPRGVGTGVVVVDKGIILTNLHVVAGAPRIRVQFANGLESDAQVINEQPENDLAVLQAANIPDDLVPATLRSTQGLQPGDKVMAVGFPFNIGPSASSGVISGLHRNYMSQEGERVLANLIQFDAAANPGNSGGPLVTMDGQVVGIVTAILNPNEQSTFVGIGFAVPIESAAAAAGESPF